MNSPEEKAKAIVEKFRNELSWIEKDYTVDLWRDARQCAIIAVDAIIDSWSNDDGLHFHVTKKYWQKVKEEIQKL